MVKLLSLVGSALAAPGFKSERYDLNAPKIIGGSEAAEGQFPWQISQRRIQLGQPSSHMCGGSIGGSKYIISAAHCVLDADRIIVAYGTNDWRSNDNLAEVEVFKGHPNYNPRAIDYDYSYMILKEALSFSETVQPVQLVPANANSKNNNLLYGDTATTSGWGYSQHDASGNPIVIPNKMQFVELPLNDWDTCVGFWGNPEVNPVLGKYTPRMQCCGGQGSTSCMGDSGGPLVVKDPESGETLLLGAVSWGSGKCDTSIAGVYTNIAFPEGRQWYSDEIGL